ncbi:hypothetical protein ACFYWO_40060, partial [Streptomyces sp. NPDC002932]|uniref:hypothetical protein n=1 Tax=Streptomyces sp. NPDC002932 TaxID=3364672 RepID=UPI00369484CA
MQNFRGLRVVSGSGWVHTGQQPGPAAGARRSSSCRTPDALGLILHAKVPGVGLAPASREKLPEHAAQLSEVAAAGTQQGEEVLDGPGRENPGAGQVETDRVDPVPVGGIEQQVAGQLPRRALRHLRQRAAGALEVEEQAVDDEVGVGSDLGAGERRPTDAVIGPGAGAQNLQGAVGGCVELVGDVGHQVAVRELQQPRERECAGVIEGGLGQRGEGEADRSADEYLEPGPCDEHAGQTLLFVLAVVDRLVPVVEVQAAHRLGQAHRELVSGGAHPKARAAAADPARQVDPDQGGVVDGRGRGKCQAQPLVDRCTDGAGLGADAWRRDQDVMGAVLSAVAVTQRPRTGGQFAVQEPATGRGHAWTAPTSARKRGCRHRSVAGRPAQDR